MALSGCGGTPTSIPEPAIKFGGRSFRVLSNKRPLGVLQIPNVQDTPTSHLRPGDTFEVDGELRDADTGRKYFKLADGKGWVPECSRRDRMRVVIAEEGAHRTVVDHSETQRTPRDSKHSQILTYTQT